MSDRQGAGAVRLVACALALLLVACAGSGNTYVSNNELGAFFALPQEWQTFDEDMLREQPANGAAAEFGSEGAGNWMVAFDASPEPSPRHLLNVFNEPVDFPTGLAQVRELEAAERDSFSLSTLRNSLLPLDQLSQRGENAVTARRNDQIANDEGLRGNRLVVDVSLTGGRVLTVDQTGLVDAETRQVYLFAVLCEAACYAANEQPIDRVVRSWTIEER